MNRVVSAMPTLLRTSIATMLQYRGEIILWAVWGLVFPAVSIAMWTAAAKGKSLAGYDAGDIAAYFLLTMVVGHLITAWDVHTIGYLVRTGELSPQLMRPIMPVWSGITDNIAYKLTTTVMVLPIWIGVALYVHPTFDTRAIDMLLGVPAVLLAAAVSFAWGYVLATSAFYVTKVEALAEMYFGISMFLGGRFAALAWLPRPLQLLTWALPFRWTVAFPVELLMGRLSPADAFAGLAWQTAWLMAGIVTLRWAWRRGVARYSAVGG